MKQKWCQDHYLNYKALMRARDVRSQLRKYARKFQIPLVSAEAPAPHHFCVASSHAQGDPEKIVKSIVAGYFHNAAQVQPDGTYKTLRSDHVRIFISLLSSVPHAPALVHSPQFCALRVSSAVACLPRSHHHIKTIYEGLYCY